MTLNQPTQPAQPVDTSDAPEISPEPEQPIRPEPVPFYGVPTPAGEDTLPNDVKNSEIPAEG